MSKLHPKVIEFKDFVKRHPKIKNVVRSKEKTWQEIFEEWYMFGEEDDMWEEYKTNSSETEKTSTKSKAIKNTESTKKSKKDSDFMAQVFSMIKNIDMNDLQSHINNVSGAISNVQQLIEQFQGLKNQNTNIPKMQSPRYPNHPFFHQKD